MSGPCLEAPLPTRTAPVARIASLLKSFFKEELDSEIYCGISAAPSITGSSCRAERSNRRLVTYPFCAFYESVFRSLTLWIWKEKRRRRCSGARLRYCACTTFVVCGLFKDNHWVVWVRAFGFGFWQPCGNSLMNVNLRSDYGAPLGVPERAELKCQTNLRV